MLSYNKSTISIQICCFYFLFKIVSFSSAFISGLKNGLLQGPRSLAFTELKPEIQVSLLYVRSIFNPLDLVHLAFPTSQHVQSNHSFT